MTAVFSMCVRFQKGGSVRGLGKSCPPNTSAEFAYEDRRRCQEYVPYYELSVEEAAITRQLVRGDHRRLGFALNRSERMMVFETIHSRKTGAWPVPCEEYLG